MSSVVNVRKRTYARIPDPKTLKRVTLYTKSLNTMPQSFSPKATPKLQRISLNRYSYIINAEPKSGQLVMLYETDREA